MGQIGEIIRFGMEISMKKLLFIYNPFSGKALIKDFLYDILQEINKLGMEIIIHPTKKQLEAYEHIVENKGKYDMIICSGGDGTLNEVVSALMTYDEAERPPMGYIPSGSTNDFGRSLEIPKKMSVAAQRIVEGTPQKIDVGTFNGKYFAYVAATGAFTEVSYATPQNMKNVLGHQAYIIEAVKNLTSLRPTHMVIETEYGRFEEDFIYGMITNALSVGGYRGLVPKNVKLNDGFLEAVFIKHPKTPQQVQELTVALLTQDVTRNDAMVSLKVKKISIETDEPKAWVLDGEFGGDWKKVEIGVEESAVDIILTEEI